MTPLRIAIVSTIVWVMVVALSYWHWNRVAKGLRQRFELPSRIGILLLPVWTVRAWITVSWLPRRRLRKHIKELRRLETIANPSTPPELRNRLRAEIERLETFLNRHDQSKHKN